MCRCRKASVLRDSGQWGHRKTGAVELLSENTNRHSCGLKMLNLNNAKINANSQQIKRYLFHSPD